MLIICSKQRRLNDFFNYFTTTIWKYIPFKPSNHSSPRGVTVAVTEPKVIRESLHCATYWQLNRFSKTHMNSSKENCHQGLLNSMDSLLVLHKYSLIVSELCLRCETCQVSYLFFRSREKTSFQKTIDMISRGINCPKNYFTQNYITTSSLWSL